VNRVDPKSFCFGVWGGGVNWPAGVYEIAVRHGENAIWCSSKSNFFDGTCRVSANQRSDVDSV